MSISATSMRAVVGGYLAAVNAEDWLSLERLFVPDVSLRAVGSRTRVGRADVMRYYARLFLPWAEHEDRLVRALPCGGAITVEVRFIGVTTQGRQVEFDAIDVFDISDGRITALSTWYDLVAVRCQLGPVAAG